jgi:hypothetical protein
VSIKAIKKDNKKSKVLEATTSEEPMEEVKADPCIKDQDEPI